MSFRCEVVSGLEKKPPVPVVKTCGKDHATAERALACAKRRADGPGLLLVTTCAAYEGDRLVLMVVSGEKASARGSSINCRAAWIPVPVVDGAPDKALFEQATRPGLAQTLLEGLRQRRAQGDL